MRRSSVWFAVVAAGFAVASARGQTEGELSLEEELARLKAEILRDAPTDDPFAEGRVPDLVVLSMTDVGGEVAPCG